MPEPGQLLPDGYRLVRRMASPRAWLAVHPDTPRCPLLVREPEARYVEIVRSPPDQILTWLDHTPANAWRLHGAVLLSEVVGPLPPGELRRLLLALEAPEVRGLLRGPSRLSPEVLLFGDGRVRLLPGVTHEEPADIAERAALVSWLVHPSQSRAMSELIGGRLDDRPLRHAEPLDLSLLPDSKFTTTIAGSCCTGLVRRINEDGLAWTDNGGWRLVVVADGMGGSCTGERASRAAIAAMLTALDTIPTAPGHDPEAQLQAALQRARVEVGKVEHCGATLVAALVGDGAAYILHIGDCVAWRVHRTGEVTRLTEPHTLGARMLRAGRDPADPQYVRLQHIVTRALSSPFSTPDPNNLAEYTVATLLEGEQILLATDGLWNHVSDARIAAILAGVRGPRAGVAALRQAAFDAGAPDNVTIVLFGAP